MHGKLLAHTVASHWYEDTRVDIRYYSIPEDPANIVQTMTPGGGHTILPAWMLDGLLRDDMMLGRPTRDLRADAPLTGSIRSPQAR